jgi:type VI secretion system protein VasD
MTRWLSRLIGVGLLTLLAGCPAPPPPPPPTVVNLTLKAGPDINPNPAGQPAPVAVRVYQLGSAAGFESADFFPLYNHDATTLGADLVKREEYFLAPGQTKTVTLTPMDPVKAVGVFAGWRDFQHATWRATAPIPAHQTTNVAVTIGHGGITIKAETLPPAKPAS